MDPATIALIAQLLLRYGPGVAQAVAEMFHRKDVTLDDWKKVFALVKPYEAYAPKVGE